MYKRILLILMVILTASFVSAETIAESTFENLGYSNFSVLEGTESCKVLDFGYLEQTADSRTYLNLIIENFIPIKENVTINVFLNDKLNNNIYGADIKKENRIELSGVLKEKNQLKVCINNKNLPNIIVSNASTIGSYLLGEIRPEDFYIRVLTENTYSNTLLPIDIYAENNSPKAVNVSINYANETFLKISNLETVSGETSYTGVIEPGEIKILKYYLKTNKNISFGSPLATLTYVTNFGETKTLTSAQQVINMKENLEKLEVYVDIERNVNVDEQQEGKIIIRNVSEDDLKNLTIETSFDNKVVLSNRQINTLKKYEVLEIPFQTTIDSIGAHVFNAKVYYNIGGIENGVSAESTTITANLKTDHVKEIIGVFLFITIIVYIWIVRF
jgi:hypothetical protein